MADYDLLLRTVTFGEAGSGKSCLVIAISGGDFHPAYIPTIGIDFRIQDVTCDSKNIKFQLWDAAGQRRFRGITTAYFRSAAVYVAALPMSSRECIGRFVEEESSNLVAETSRAIFREVTPLILVGTKADEVEDEAARIEFRDLVREKIIEGMADVLQFDVRPVFYVETSAKTGEGVTELAQLLAHAHQAGALRRQILMEEGRGDHLKVEFVADDPEANRGPLFPFEREVVEERVRELLREGLLIGDWGYLGSSMGGVLCQDLVARQAGRLEFLRSNESFFDFEVKLGSGRGGVGEGEKEEEGEERSVLRLRGTKALFCSRIEDETIESSKIWAVSDPRVKPGKIDQDVFLQILLGAADPDLLSVTTIPSTAFVSYYILFNEILRLREHAFVLLSRILHLYGLADLILVIEEFGEFPVADTSGILYVAMANALLRHKTAIVENSVINERLKELFADVETLQKTILSNHDGGFRIGTFREAFFCLGKDLFLAHSGSLNVTLACDPSITEPSHVEILVWRLSFVHRLLDFGGAESEKLLQEGVLSVKNLTSAFQLKALLEFAYTGSLPESIEPEKGQDVLKLLQSAQMYDDVEFVEAVVAKLKEMTRTMTETDFADYFCGLQDDSVVDDDSISWNELPIGLRLHWKQKGFRSSEEEEAVEGEKERTEG